MFQERMKGIFNKKTKPEDFGVGDVVLKWDAVHEDKGKHGKFDHLWKGPCKREVPQALFSLRKVSIFASVYIPFYLTLHVWVVLWKIGSR